MPSRELKKLRTIYLKYLEKGKLPLPRIIHVETRSKCNGRCCFCPASVMADKREDVYMSEAMIKKIVNELHRLDYPNRLSFYNNNEPFLDERIFKLVKLARERLPRAYLELKSNGKTLTTEKILEIFNAGLDMLYINDYSQSGQLSKNIQKIKKDLEKIRRFKGHLEERQYSERIKISFRSINEILGTRAGSNPSRVYEGEPMQKLCFRPFEMMTINPKGEVSVCSEDFYCTIKMGDVKKQSLLAIWHSKKWDELRRRLIRADRSYTSACAKCDYKGFTYEMLKENDLYSSYLKRALKTLREWVFRQSSL